MKESIIHINKIDYKSSVASINSSIKTHEVILNNLKYNKDKIRIICDVVKSIVESNDFVDDLDVSLSDFNTRLLLELEWTNYSRDERVKSRLEIYLDDLSYVYTEYYNWIQYKKEGNLSLFDIDEKLPILLSTGIKNADLSNMVTIYD